MPRKKSVSGRARVSSPESRLLLQVAKLNKRIRGLERSGYYGKYSGKSLLEFADRNKYVRIKRARGSRRHRLFLRRIKEATMGELKEIRKTFEHFLGARTLTPVGIKKVSEEIKAKAKATLSGARGKAVTDQDMEVLYEVSKYSSNEIIQQIGNSEFTLMVFEARDYNYGVERWVQMIIEHGVTVNNEYTRNQCVYLYNKFVR